MRAINADEIYQIVSEYALTAKEAAEYLGKTYAGIWYAAKHCGLRSTKNGLFIKPDLDEYRASVKIGRPSKDEN